MAIALAIASVLGMLRLVFVRLAEEPRGYLESKLSDVLHAVMNAVMAAMFSPWWNVRMALPVMGLFAALAAVLAARLGMTLRSRKSGTASGSAALLGANGYHLVATLAMAYSQYDVWRERGRSAMQGGVQAASSASVAGEIVIHAVAALFLADALATMLVAVFLPDVMAKALGDRGPARGVVSRRRLQGMLTSRIAVLAPHVVMNIAMSYMLFML